MTINTANNRPKIVAITGSTRFKSDFRRIAAEETLSGHIVLTVHVFRNDPEWRHLTSEQLNGLTELFNQYLHLCDELIVISNGTIGEHTAIDIAHAKAIGKLIRYEAPILPASY